MKNQNSRSFNYMSTVYLSLFLLISAIAYLLFKHEPIIFRRVFNLWPIGVLILSVLLQYVYLEKNHGFLLPLAGFTFLYGILFTINLHNPFYSENMALPIFLLALAVSLLNLYAFKKRNDLLLPFIFILILGSIILLVLPYYNKYLGLTNAHLPLTAIIVLIVCYTFLKTTKK